MAIQDSHLRELKTALRDTLSENDAIVEHAEANREEGDGNFDVELIPISRGESIFRGDYFSAS